MSFSNELLLQQIFTLGNANRLSDSFFFLFLTRKLTKMCDVHAFVPNCFQILGSTFAIQLSSLSLNV